MNSYDPTTSDEDPAAAAARCPPSDWNAWRDLLQRCLKELGLAADLSAKDGSIVCRMVNPPSFAEFCGPASGIDFVAAVDACLAERAAVQRQSATKEGK